MDDSLQQPNSHKVTTKYSQFTHASFPQKSLKLFYFYMLHIFPNVQLKAVKQ